MKWREEGGGRDIVVVVEMVARTSVVVGGIKTRLRRRAGVVGVDAAADLYRGIVTSLEIISSY